ncbi:MAG: T9SS type A sorting domain-containing protein [Flavobacteriaceae bacterium]|nr:T9SS type A sorting domain-containing protein [Flavobacteriaceae bacterium]
MVKKYFLIAFLLFSFLGFAQLQENNAVEVYPNPFKDAVTIKIVKPVDNFKVYDILGKQIVLTDDKEKLKKLLLKLKPGIYLLKVTDKNGNVETKKVLKQ